MKNLIGNMLDKIHCADAFKFLRRLPSDLVDLIMTSPPYWEPKRPREVDWREYVDTVTILSAELLRILKPTGHYYLVIGDAYLRKEKLGLPFRVRLALNDIGWKSLDDIIWRKTQSFQDLREKPAVRHPYEFLLHFSKTKKCFGGSIRKSSIEKDSDEIWEIADATPAFKGKHYESYPEGLCVRSIKSSCPSNGIVLDPLCGVGTTCVVAKRLGRHYIGVEVDCENCRLARLRLSKIPV